MSVTEEITPEVKEVKDETEVIEPTSKTIYRKIGTGEGEMVFTQRPLSFFGKMELFSLLGNALDKAMKDNDLSIAEILETPGDRAFAEISASQLREADSFIKGVAKLVQHVPEFLKDLYCVALNVPRGERDYVKLIMDTPEEEGGISDDEGVDILDTFIEQNWEPMYDFFGKKIVPLIQKVSQKAQNSPSSKPSKATQRRTPKQ